MEKKEFNQKLILLILEKCVIVIIISIVGLFINGQLKDIDLQNNKIILEQQAQNDSLKSAYEEKRLSLQNEYDKDSESFRAKLDSLKEERLNLVKEEREIDRQEHRDKMLENKKLHEEEIERIKQEYSKDLTKLQDSLNAGICRLNAEFRYFNRVNLSTIEEVAEVWNKIYEYDYIAEKLVNNIVLFDSLASIGDTLIKGTPLKETIKDQTDSLSKKILDIDKEYEKQKEMVQEIILKKRFWLTDELIEDMHEYLSLVDEIVFLVTEKGKSWTYKTILIRKKGYDDSVLDSLRYAKKQIRRTIFEERESLRVADK